MAKRKGESQYEVPFEIVRRRGSARLGLMTSHGWYDDPKRLAFTLARYKFVAKMFDGMKRVLEIGCGDGFGAHVVAQSVDQVIGVDFDDELLRSARTVANAKHKIKFKYHNMMTGPFPGKFDGVYCMDVLEHIRSKDEARFLTNMVASLDRHGVCIIGSPSRESQIYASKYSKLGHVNCKSQADLKATMKKYFHNVFMFSMNDEVVHTGYGKMSHYNIALCCSRKT
jgi:2-polyprenyl-3-methyl-5-hydroxy-6-metoxy-1,4-benzoquinol methylase